jgi:hypothetical protein
LRRNAVSGSASREKLSARELVERASVVLDRIIRTFNDRAMVEYGSAEVDGVEVEETQSALLRTVILGELDNLDQHFLAALNGCAQPRAAFSRKQRLSSPSYVNAASRGADKQLLSLLLAVREETLDVVAQQFSPDLQAVDMLTRASGAAERARLVAELVDGGDRESLEAAENACSRVVEQMEDTDAVVVDARLLVRTTLAREAVRSALHELSGSSVPPGAWGPSEAPESGVGGWRETLTTKVITSAFPPNQLPKWEAALLKELLPVGDPVLRRGLLQHAFTQALAQDNNPDKGASRGGLRPVGSDPLRAARGRAAPGGGKGADAPPPVRPGRFLNCIANLRADIAQAEGYRTEREMRDDPMAARVVTIREETLAVLQAMADDASLTS